MLIVTAGMIGVGKSTLTKEISKRYESTPFYEPVDGNPYLEKFYNDKERYSLHLQLYFLNRRFSMIKKALQDDNNVLDRSIYEDRLFAYNLVEDGTMDKDDFKLYDDMLENMLEELEGMPKKSPDLLVYAYSDFDTILKRIKKRGRDYEQIDNPNKSERENQALRDYYRGIYDRYQKWYEEYDYSNKIAIDLDKYDLSIPENIEKVLEIIDVELKKSRK